MPLSISSALPPFAAPAADSAPRARSPRADRAAGEPALEERRVLARLQQRDREVRAHEMAHLAAGAGIARGGPSYTYERGPDGRLYAVGGEVGIDTSPGRTPEETIERAQRIRAAALAPADPSPQDRQVAAAAGQMEMQARLELATRQRRDADERGTQAPPGAAGELGRRIQDALQPAVRGTLLDIHA